MNHCRQSEPVRVSRQSEPVKHYAHSRRGASRGEWHSLEDHLTSVAAIASQFGEKLHSPAASHLAGLWHDLGKYAPDWQQFLLEAGEDAPVRGEDTPSMETRRRGPDHSTAGAIHAKGSGALDPMIRDAISFAIAGHHGGLADRENLRSRLADTAKIDRYKLAIGEAPKAITEERLGSPPSWLASGDVAVLKRSYEFFVRMLFSSLVDADFLDTERFMDEAQIRPAARKEWPELRRYLAPLEARLEALQSGTQAALRVASARRRVVQWCSAAAALSPGTFTLTVPTGGGKTLASLSFAIRHALEHGLDRVVIALPFLSIVDQTASVFREIYEPQFGDRVLVEHHSNIVPERDTLRNRVAAENWDAPLVVTTQVQLFESLFARRPSDCRKLHNLSRSVIVLDEVQSLPAGLLDPILESIQELSQNYGSTVLLMTATQPALHTRPLGAGRFCGLTPEPREIVPPEEIEPLFRSFERVEVHWPGVEATTWPDLASEMAAQKQALAIVHRRADAAELWKELSVQAPNALHLSALMCPAHRREVLAEIRTRLAEGKDCLVVSTQLVEAGVDLDFPVVFRAMAGLESLAQSAGRCNREGRLERGIFNVFRAPSDPVGLLRHRRDVAEMMLRFDGALDLFEPSTFRRYFDRVYAATNRDARDVQVARQSAQFELTAERFRMIDDATMMVYVPYGSGGQRAIDQLRHAGAGREWFRSIQPFGVAIYPAALRMLQDTGAVELIAESVSVLVVPHLYDHHLGLQVDRQPFETFIV